MPASLVQGLEAITLESPDAIALSWRGSRWSYRELDQAIAGVRSALRARGIPRGARVALLMRNSPHYVACYYGILGAGCVVVPLNPLECAPVLLRQASHCGASLVLGNAGNPGWSAVSEALGAAGIAALGLELHEGHDDLQQFVEALGGGAGAVPVASQLPADLASIIYTSGTTGRPKGVMLSHGNLHSNALAIARYLELGTADCGLAILPLHYSYGNSVLHSHLMVGARLVLDDNLVYPHETLQCIEREGVTGLPGVPATFALLLHRCRLQDYDLRSLRYLTQAGGPMPPAVVDQLRQALPSPRIFLMYGQTEATARLAWLPPEELAARPGSVGIPIDGVELDIRRHGRSLPRGVEGEICARGPNVMLGYWDDPAATAEVLHDGWLHTGDLGWLDEDDYLFVKGRLNSMIKVGAYRVSPEEIEEVVAALPGVAEVGVTGVDDGLLGQAVKVVIVPRPGAELAERAVKAHCRQRLASYKIPKIIEFAPGLPRGSTGKIQRFKLA